MAEREVRFAFLGDTETLVDVMSEIEAGADDLPAKIRTNMIHPAVRGQSLDIAESVATILVALGGGAGIATVIRSIANAIATVLRARPGRKLRIEVRGSTFELDGCSESALVSVLKNAFDLSLEDSISSDAVIGLGVPDHLLLDQLYDPISARYFVPDVPRFEIRETGLERAEVRPTAILDTGMMSHHPWIQGRIEGAVDFTGEGIEDQNGHGTFVTLMYLAGFAKASLLNVKVLNREIAGNEENLIAGLTWAVEHGADSINLSLGIIRPIPCGPKCKICGLVTEITESGVRIVAAAGNHPTAYFCPARAPGVLSIGAANPEGTAVRGYSGAHPMFVVPEAPGMIPLENSRDNDS